MRDRGSSPLLQLLLLSGLLAAVASAHYLHEWELIAPANHEYETYDEEFDDDYDARDSATDDISPTPSIPETSTPLPSLPATPTTPTTTTTTPPGPVIEGKDLFEQTKIVLDNITLSLEDFESKIDTLTEGEPDGVPISDVLKMVETLAETQDEAQINIDEICVEERSNDCAEFKTILNTIHDEVTILVDKTEEWNSDKLGILKEESGKLASKVYGDNSELMSSINKDKADSILQSLIDEMETGSAVAQREIDRFNKEEQDTIIFVSVFGAVCGLMVVALVIGGSFVAYRTSKQKKSAAKKYSQVPKETIPVQSFLSSNDNPTFQSDETIEHRSHNANRGESRGFYKESARRPSNDWDNSRSAPPGFKRYN